MDQELNSSIHEYLKKVSTSAVAKDFEKSVGGIEVSSMEVIMMKYTVFCTFMP